jgi:hypothetical protein
MEKDGMMILMVWEGEGYVSLKTRCTDTSKKGKGSFSISVTGFESGNFESNCTSKKRIFKCWCDNLCNLISL